MINHRSSYHVRHASSLVTIVETVESSYIGGISLWSGCELEGRVEGDFQIGYNQTGE